MTYRLIVCFDIEEDSLEGAYAQLESRLRHIPIPWETSDEAYDEDGEGIDPAVLQKAIVSVLNRHDREEPAPPLKTADGKPALVWGEPGTGKTSFVDELIAQHGGAYLLRTDAEPGLTYCENADRLLGEIDTFIEAYVTNGATPEEALAEMEVAKLENNHGMLKPAFEYVEVRYDDSRPSLQNPYGGWFVCMTDEAVAYIMRDHPPESWAKKEEENG
jgi:hypothetical protein